MFVTSAQSPPRHDQTHVPVWSCAVSGCSSFLEIVLSWCDLEADPELEDEDSSMTGGGEITAGSKSKVARN